jgi:hypothetical protein
MPHRPPAPFQRSFGSPESWAPPPAPPPNLPTWYTIGRLGGAAGRCRLSETQLSCLFRIRLTTLALPRPTARSMPTSVHATDPAICHATTGDQHVASRIPSPASRAGGRAWSAPASRSIPTASTSSAPMCWACMGTDRPGQPASDGAPYGHALSGHHHPRHGARAYRAARSSWGSSGCTPWSADRWAGCRR